MLRGKLLAGILIIAVIFGCAKKKVQNDTEFSQATKKTEQPQSSTADIFEEFYKDDSNNAEPVSSAAKEKETALKKTIPAPVSTGFTSDGRYVVQISTLGSRALADHLVEQLDAKGYPAYVAEVQNPTPQLFGTYYRVRIGRFSLISSARAFGNETLKPMGYDFWVDNKSNDNVGIEGSGFGESNPASNLNPTYQTYPSYSEQAAPVTGQTMSTPPAVPAPSTATTDAKTESTAPVTPAAAPATESSQAPVDEEW